MARQLQIIHGSVVQTDGTPLVFIQFGEETGTVSVEDAVQFGAGVIGSAQKAMLESRVLAWLRDKFGGKVPDEKILVTFEEFRKFQPEQAAMPPAAPPVEETPEEAILRALGEIRGEVSNNPV